MNKKGYVTVTSLLSNYQLKNLTFDNLKYIVETDNKQRYDLKLINSIYYIRTNQGHSSLIGSIINDDDILIEIKEPFDSCLHGTYKSNLENIKKTGLNKMNRKHIHFTNSLKSKSGIRYNCDVIIYIDIKKAMNDGIKFYKSKNDVILSSGID